MSRPEKKEETFPDWSIWKGMSLDGNSKVSQMDEEEGLIDPPTSHFVLWDMFNYIWKSTTSKWHRISNIFRN
jgi:hypothetical protein